MTFSLTDDARSAMAVEMWHLFYAASRRREQYGVLDARADTLEQQYQTQLGAWSKLYPHEHWLDFVSDDMLYDDHGSDQLPDEVDDDDNEYA